MGEPVRIMDLARRMVELSGLTVREEPESEGDIEIQITGLRPGEKLYEELLIGDNPEPTEHPRIMRAREEFLPWQRLHPALCDLSNLLSEGDMLSIRQRLLALVADYAPSDEIVDRVFQTQLSSHLEPRSDPSGVV
jgi:FlaA1/EpsC-like NDP-sugar epimerase